ncbi:MAG: beta-ketoacyl synthase N-terminal-like domain-containing protein [Polyangiaceae bacterium]
MDSGGRVFVTGVGLTTPLAEDREGTWDALLAGRRGLRPITFFDTTGQRGVLGGVVETLRMPDADPGAGLVWSRSTTLALMAAREAMAHARLSVKDARVGLVIGGTTGGMFETEAHLAALHADPDRHDAILELLTHPLSAAGDSLHVTLGPFARVRTLSTACSSGANAMILAALWLLSGELDAVVAGGSDGLCRLTLSGFNALAAVDPELCRPFDRTRRGLNVGEGAGFLVLERADKRRGASVVAELAGWGLGSEAHHITNPEASGRTAARVILDALAGRPRCRRTSTTSTRTAPARRSTIRWNRRRSRARSATIARVPVSSSSGRSAIRSPRPVASKPASPRSPSRGRRSSPPSASSTRIRPAPSSTLRSVAARRACARPCRTRSASAAWTRRCS